MPLTLFGIGGAIFGLEQLKRLPPVIVKPPLCGHCVMLLWQQRGGGVYVQASADKCRLEMRLPTLRNELIINAVHVKSVGCRQIARLTK